MSDCVFHATRCGRATISCLSRSMRLIPRTEVSTDNADTMSAVVKLAGESDESASDVVVYDMVR